MSSSPDKCFAMRLGDPTHPLSSRLQTRNSSVLSGTFAHQQSQSVLRIGNINARKSHTGRRNALKNERKISKVLASVNIPVFVAALLTACGGSGPEPYPAQSGDPMRVKTSATSSGQGATAPGTTEKFDGFNPSIWNERKWYECNCGINPNTPPVAPPQDGLLLGNRA